MKHVAAARKRVALQHEHDAGAALDRLRDLLVCVLRKVERERSVWVGAAHGPVVGEGQQRDGQQHGPKDEHAKPEGDALSGRAQNKPTPHGGLGLVERGGEQPRVVGAHARIHASCPLEEGGLVGEEAQDLCDHEHVRVL